MAFNTSTVAAAKQYQFTTKTAEKPATALTNEPVLLNVPFTWPGFDDLGATDYLKIAVLDDSDNQKPVEIEYYKAKVDAAFTTAEDRLLGTNQNGLDEFVNTVGTPTDNDDFYTFDGTSDGINKTDSITETSYDYVARFRVHDKSKGVVQVIWKSGGTGNGYAIGIDASGNLGQWGRLSSTATSITIASTDYENDVWYDLYCTRTSTTLVDVATGEVVAQSTGTVSPGSGSDDESCGYCMDGNPMTGDGAGSNYFFDGDVEFIKMVTTGNITLPVNGRLVLHSVLPSTDDTGLKLYYDETQDDNTTYVGDTGDTIAETVWESARKLNYLFGQDPSGTAPQIIDSTDNDNDGTTAGSMTSGDLIDMAIGKGIDLDGSDDEVSFTSPSLSTGAWTIGAIINPTATADGDGILVSDGHGLVFVDGYIGCIKDDDAALRGTSTVTNGTEIFVVATYDGSSTVTYYEDGADVGTSVTDATWGLTSVNKIGSGKSSGRPQMKIGNGFILNDDWSSDQVALQHASMTDALFDFALASTGTVDHLIYWDQPYGNTPNAEHLLYWDHSYALFNYIIGYFDQVYGIQLQRYWDHTYGNNPLVKVFWDLLYGDQQQIKRFWDLEYGDRVELIKYWDHKYNIRAAIQQFWDHKYGILGKEILKHWDQPYDVKNTNPLMKWFDQYYHIVADSVVESAALGFYIDGVRYEGPYHVSWELNVDSYKNTGEMHFNYPAPFFAAGEGKEMRIVDTDIDLKLEITIPTKSESTNETLYFIKGESKSRILEYSNVFTETFRNTTAAAICTTIAARYGITIDWQIPDWPLSEYDVNDQTPLQAIRTLTEEAAKACLQTDFNGDTVRVVKRKDSDSDKWDTDTPSYYITDSLHLEQTNQRGEYKKGYNAYRVTDQSSASETRTWIEDEEYAEAKREVHVFRVPWDGTVRPLYTSDNNATIQYLGIVTEDLEEEFSIVNGEGENKTTKPAYGIVSYVPNDIDLGTPTITEEGTVQTPTIGTTMYTVTYTTKYYKWLVTDYDDPKIQIWVE